MSRSLVSLSVVFLAALAVVIGSAGVAQARLVGYWPLNDTSGTVAADQSGAAITNHRHLRRRNRRSDGEQLPVWNVRFVQRRQYRQRGLYHRYRRQRVRRRGGHLQLYGMHLVLPPEPQ